MFITSVSPSARERPPKIYLYINFIRWKGERQNKTAYFRSVCNLDRRSEIRLYRRQTRKLLEKIYLQTLAISTSENKLLIWSEGVPFAGKIFVHLNFDEKLNGNHLESERFRAIYQIEFCTYTLAGFSNEALKNRFSYYTPRKCESTYE